MNEPRAILTKRRLSSKVKDPDAALTSTTFTYQGQLKDANGPVTGAFDFQFVLYLAQAGGERLGASEMVDVVLTNGMFSFKLDFGRAAFEAKESWLEIGVRPSGGAEPYTVLFPRQKLTPTPYAIFAQHEQWGLIGVPVGFTDRAVIDKLTSVSTTEEVASKSSVEAQPTAKLEPPKEPSHAAEPAGGRMEITGTDDPLLLINHTGTSGSPAIWFQQDGATKAYLWWNKDTSRLNLGTPTTNPIMSLQDNGNVGIGTTTPASTLDIRTAQDGLRISGYQPFLTLTDTNSGRRGRIQSANGILGFQTEGDIANHLLSSVEIEDAPDAKTPRLLVRAQNGLETVGYQPFLTLSDSNAGYAHIRIQDVGGDMNFQTHSATTNPAGGSVMYIKDGTGNVGIGTANPQAKLDVVGMVKAQVLQITGADIAEPFNLTDTQAVQPGMLVAIDANNPGHLRMADKAYDRTVAGVISGANGINTAVIMKQEGTLADGSHWVALSGRVYCWADASNGPIEPGDLLTTSDTPGHAMKVTDHIRAQGAIIGKAMTSLKQGQGLVLVLVTLQ